MTAAVYQGFHGASLQNAHSIVRDGVLRPSMGRHHWFGEGRYFFLQGISDPFENAQKWASAQAWCDQSRRNLYTRCAVLSASVQSDAERICDLRDIEHAKLFERARQAVVKRLRTVSRRINYVDSMVFDYLAEKLDLGVFIGDQYIKFKFERVNAVNSRIPNVTMMCARDDGKVVISDLTVAWEGAV